MNIYKIECINMEIFHANSQNVFEIVRIRVKAYSKNHFSSHFTIKMLNNYYKLLIINSQFPLIAKENNLILGYLLAGKNINNGVSQFVKTNKYKLFFLLLIHPTFFIEKIVSKFTNNNSPKSKAAIQLLDIAVDPEHQGKGVAKKLISCLESEIKNSNPLEKNYGLSVRRSNTKALDLYLKIGFEIEFEHGNTLQLIKKL